MTSLATWAFSSARRGPAYPRRIADSRRGQHRVRAGPIHAIGFRPRASEAMAGTQSRFGSETYRASRARPLVGQSVDSSHSGKGRRGVGPSSRGARPLPNVANERHMSPRSVHTVAAASDEEKRPCLEHRLPRQTVFGGQSGERNARLGGRKRPSDGTVLKSSTSTARSTPRE